MLKNGKYPICFWNYMSLAQFGNEPENQVALWKKAGMTVAMTPVFNPEKDDRNAMLRLLDACAEADIMCLVHDARVNWAGVADEKAFRARIQGAIDDFGAHPAVLGFHVGDEPGCITVNRAYSIGLQDVSDSIRALQILKEMAPDKKHFINMLPGGYYSSKRMGFFNRKYEDVIGDYIRQSGVEYIGYDAYAQMDREDSGFGFYFKNIDMFMKAAKRNGGIPVWNTIASYALLGYRAPSFYDYRWQFSTSAAHGIKGICFFYLYGDDGQPIGSKGNVIPDRFADLSNACNEFQALYGPLLMTFKHKWAYHVGRTYGGMPIFEEGLDDTALYVRVNSGDGAIISRFEDNDNRSYYAITNNSPFKSIESAVTFNGFETEIFKIGTGGAETKLTDLGSSDGRFDSVGIKVVPQKLDPGEMRLYRVVPRHM